MKDTAAAQFREWKAKRAEMWFSKIGDVDEDSDLEEAELESPMVVEYFVTVSFGEEDLLRNQLPLELKLFRIYLGNICSCPPFFAFDHVY